MHNRPSPCSRRTLVLPPPPRRSRILAAPCIARATIPGGSVDADQAPRQSDYSRGISAVAARPTARSLRRQRRGPPIPESAWTSRKAQQLVRLLALAPGHRLTRDQVLDALWPDQDPDAFAATFRQTCYLARRTLGHPGSLAVHDGLGLLAPPAACQVDSVAFEAAAATARRSQAIDDYAAALARYPGDLLPEDRYADWALGPAERLQALATALRRELAACQAGYPRGIRPCQRPGPD